MAPAGGGGERSGTYPIQTLIRQWSEGARGGATGAARHACRLISDPKPAAPWSGGWIRSSPQGGRAGRWRGRCKWRWRPATGKRQGGRPRTRGAALLPFPKEAESLLEDLLQVSRSAPGSVRRRTSGHRGMNLPQLRQGGPPHIVTRGRKAWTALATSRHVASGPGWVGGGGLAGGVVVQHPAPRVHPHCVGPAIGHLPLEEGEAAERAEEPARRGVVPALHPAVPGRPPQRLARLLPPHGRQVPAPCVGAAGAAGSGRGARA